MTILVHRESVRPADGAQAKLFEAPSHASFGDLLDLIRSARFLPRVPGSRAVWIVEGEAPLAVLTQEFRDPWPLVGLGTPLWEVAGRLPRPHVSFRFLGRRSPEDVYRELGGDPVRLERTAWEPAPDIPWGVALREFFQPHDRRGPP